MSFTNYTIPVSTPNYSNYSNLGMQALNGCTDPKRETNLYQLYTLKNLYQTNFLPRYQNNFQVAKRYSNFPLENEMTNKSANIHISSEDTYYDIIKTPKRCTANYCGETNIPVYVDNNLRV